MGLDAIAIDENGGLTLCYDDEVFAGHTIQVSFNLEGILSDTDIPGWAVLVLV